jgi:group I intron endonuclease
MEETQMVWPTIARKPGVYAIIHKRSGRVYIGSSGVSIVTRWHQHRSALRRNKHSNERLQNYWNKYGEKSFEFKVIEVVLSHELLQDREQFWIDHCDSANRNVGFNIAPRADKSVLAQETIDKHSKAMKGRPGVIGNPRLTENDVQEIRLLLAEGCKPKDIASKFAVSDATITRIASKKIWSHIPVSEEIQEKIRNRPNPLIGRKQSQKQKQAVSACMKGNSHGVGKHSGKLSEEVTKQIRVELAHGAIIKDLAVKYSVHPVTISRVLWCKTWWGYEPDPSIEEALQKRRLGKSKNS